MTIIKSILSAILILALAACAQEQATEQTHAPDGDPPGSFPAQVGDPNSLHQPKRTGSLTVAAEEVLAPERSSLLALSSEEADWLDRHNYPTPEELEALPTYDIGQLESSVRNRRDPKAAALLGHRRMLDGDIHGAVIAFARGAELGSLYARQQHAISGIRSATGLSLDALSEADQGNLGVMVAQLEVARMLGDHRAQAYIDTYAANFDWETYGEHVFTQTAEFMRQYGEGARARGGQAMGPDPRPNADAWLRLQSDPNTLVTIYKRERSYP